MSNSLQPTRLPRPWDSPGKNTGVGCQILLQCMKVKNESEVAQLCLTLRDPMDCSLPGSSVHGTFQARVLEWDAIVFCSSHESAAVRAGDFWSNQHPFAKLCLMPRYYRDWNKSPLGFPKWLNGKESACNAGDAVQSLGWEDPLEDEMIILPRILAWEIPKTEKPGGLQSMGSQMSWPWLSN